MAGITLAIATARLDIWLAADAAVAGGQSYQVASGGGDQRMLTRANAAEIRKNIDYWQNWVNKLTRAAAGRNRTRYVVPE